MWQSGYLHDEKRLESPFCKLLKPLELAYLQTDTTSASHVHATQTDHILHPVVYKKGDKF